MEHSGVGISVCVLKVYFVLVHTDFAKNHIKAMS